ncbi:MAG TPA: hypothetical protein VKA84_29250 [Gemmatimonadaceae bacterium]|nr:hypothetical protein [Gemmatimonadaceae bacterium]
MRLVPRQAIRRAARLTPIVLAAASLITVLGAARPAAGAAKSPPWISIESPPNPFDIATKNAFLVVRAFHDGSATSTPVTGAAYGLVNGQRQTIPLKFERMRSGGFSLAKQWPNEGLWTLVINVQDKGEMATALVEIGSSGEITSVRVPTKQEGSATVPRRVTSEEIAATLDRRAE